MRPLLKAVWELDSLEVQRSFEELDTAFVLISVKVMSPALRALAPYHWFLSDETKPPFDFVVEPVVGTFRKLTHYLDSSLTFMPASEVTEVSGLPVLDTSRWSDKVFHIEEKGRVSAFMSNSDLHLRIAGTPLASKKVQIGCSFACLFDSSDRLVGVALCSLTESEMGFLRRAGIIPPV